MKIIIEPSCAVPLAAVMEAPELFKNIKSGHYIDGRECRFGQPTILQLVLKYSSIFGLRFDYAEFCSGFRALSFFIQTRQKTQAIPGHPRGF